MIPAHDRIHSDYNRGLVRPVRWAHALWSRTGGVPWRWAGGGRAWWARPLIIGLATGAAFVPFDGAIAAFMRNFQEGGRWRIGGDARLIINTVQQFGDLATSLLIAWAILLLDRNKARRFLDWAFAAGLTLLALNVLKLLLGRPRPRFAEPLGFIGPWGTHAVELGAGESASIHAWEFWKHGAAQLWSMPSSHTSAAFATAVVLARLYPALRPMVFTLAGFVGLARVLGGAHYPSDVVVGATIALVVAGGCMDTRLGQRIVSRGRPPIDAPSPPDRAGALRGPGSPGWRASRASADPARGSPRR